MTSYNAEDIPESGRTQWPAFIQSKTLDLTLARFSRNKSDLGADRERRIKAPVQILDEMRW